MNAMSQGERTACYKLAGLILGRLSYAIPDTTSEQYQAVDLLILEVENELSASRCNSSNSSGGGTSENPRDRGEHELVAKVGPLTLRLSVGFRREIKQKRNSLQRGLQCEVSMNRILVKALTRLRNKEI